MNKKELKRIREIQNAAKSGNMRTYLSALTPHQTSQCIAVIEKWKQESEIKYNKDWYKADSASFKQAVEQTEIREMQIIANLLFPFLQKKFLEGVQRRQRKRRNSL